MPNVTLVRPVRHDGEKYHAGEILENLTDKDAARLVMLGAATMGKTVTIKAESDDESATPVLGLTPEKEAALNKIRRKADALAALRDAGIKASDEEKLDTLKEMLAKAWAEPLPVVDTAPALSSEEEEELNSMTSDELRIQLEEAEVAVTGQETREELRAKLKAAWSANLKVGD